MFKYALTTSHISGRIFKVSNVFENLRPPVDRSLIETKLHRKLVRSYSDHGEGKYHNTYMHKYVEIFRAFLTSVVRAELSLERAF